MTSVPRTFEFQDSEVGAVSVEGSLLRVRLSAAQVHEQGIVGYLAGVVLELGDARWQGELAECVGALAEGSLHVNGRRCHPAPLPFAHEGEARLHLHFKSGASLSALAQQVRIHQLPGAGFTESMAC
ncbi:MAG: hypothetical protein RLZZ618_3961 [Pseudomonadota bacterium]|jgi:hypothetical protein